MNQKNVLELIIDQIYQLESYVREWRDSEKVPGIEKDMVQRKLQQIYDQVKHLEIVHYTQGETKSIPTQEPAPKKNTPDPEITVPGPVQEIIFEKTTEITQETKPVIHEIPLKTEPVKKIVEVLVTKTQVETEKIKETPREVLAEKQTQTHKLINETIKTRTVMDVSSKIKASPIHSIQSAINLNDKFLFIRELFKNNNLLYNQTIDRLNKANNYEEAISIIEKEFSWDMNDVLVLKLVELIKRKHNA